MKDNDFEEIGKRLYDTEADPPKDGWNKIGASLNSPRQSGKVVWLKKNWWKPLILLIPISFYVINSEQGPKELELSSSLVMDTAGKQTTQPVEERDGTVDSESYVSRSSSVISGEQEDSSSLIAEVDSDKAELFSNKASARQELHEQPALVSKEISKVESEKQETEAGSSASATVTKGLTNTQVATGKQYTTSSLTDKIDTQVEKGSTENTNDPAKNERPINNGISDEPEAKVSEPTGVIVHDQNNLNTESPSDEIKSPVQSSGSLQAKDKTEMETVVTEKNNEATSSSVVEEEEEKKSKNSLWRLTALVAPQFSTKGPKPVGNDEVLVTEIETSGHPVNTGYGLAFGAGRSVTTNFYIDGQLSFTKTKQDTYFSAATGNVDTLIAVRQTDQSVLVSPVYEVNNREISSEYRYAGITLGATYYFWSTPRRRFNITANAGAQYLLTAKVSEKIDGQWWMLSTENVNKMNYTVMVAAGYNIRMNQGWELMINPSLMYYLRATDSDLPYNLNQGLFGLNVMLSKTLGRAQ